MTNDFHNRVKQFMQEQERVARKLKIATKLTVFFPKKSRMPVISRIALWFVRKQGAVLDMQFTDLKRK